MAEHARDSQAAAFRDAGPDDWTDDAVLARMIESGELLVVTDGPTKSIEAYEAERWDAGRIGPKNLVEARGALIRRVEDPAAPDDDSSAYEGLDHGDYQGGR